jgi:hypothetical protein
MTRKQQWIPFILIALVVTLVLAFFTAVTHAQPTATITADKESITVGDPVILTVSVTHPEGSVVLFPELEANWGDFVVRSQSAPETVSNGDGSAVTTQQIDARLFAPGDFQTPPLTIAISDAAGNLSETAVPSLPLTVQSVLVEGDTELRDIKPQAELPLPAVWPYVVGALLAITAVIAFVFFRRRQKSVVDNRLPHEKALDALVMIDKQGYVANGRYKEHYAAVSDTLRLYFETITQVPFTDRTTAEIRHDVEIKRLGDWETTPEQSQRNPNLIISQSRGVPTANLLRLLEDADLVKFAKVTPSQHEAERLTQEARQLVWDTKPQPTAEEINKKSGRKNKRNGRKVSNQPKKVTA